jgi:hemolysin activation/secretion protein
LTGGRPIFARAGAVGACAVLLIAVPPAPAIAQGTALPTFAVSRFRVEGDNPLGPERAQAVLAPFAGPAVTLDQLQEAAASLERALHDAGFGFYKVVLPPQDTEAEVALRVLAFTIGTVRVRNNEFRDEANVRASLPELKEGGSPNTLKLARDLALANENPGRRIVSAFRAGAVPDTVDATLEVSDSRPLSGFAQLANTGTAATGMQRLTVGMAHSNLFDRDHQLTATYTTSPEYSSKVRQWGAFYRAPLYGWGGMLSAYYTESNVQSGSAAGVAITGGGQFGGIQYTQYFAPRGDYRDYLTLGYDFKLFESNVTGAPAGCARIGSHPVTLSYSGRYDGADALLTFNVDLVRNLPGGVANSQSAYDACNPPADPSKNLTAAWSAMRFGADLAWRLPRDWQFASRLRYQGAGQQLIPGEKFGVGGASSVRALGERALVGDGGVQFSAELWSPALAGGVRALVFYDHGRVKNLNPLAGFISYSSAPAGVALLAGHGLTSYDSVGSIGLGLRWQYQNNFSIALDYAQVVQGNTQAGDVLNLQNVRGHNRLHMNALLRF